MRPEHAAMDGTVRSWSDKPDPTEEYNCRCYAEALIENGIPIPPQQQNCKMYEDLYTTAKASYEDAEAKVVTLLKEIEKLQAAYNQLIQDLEKSLGMHGVVGPLLTISVPKMKFLGEILERLLGKVIGDNLVQKTEDILRKLNNKKALIEHKKSQLAMALAQKEYAKKALAEAEEKMLACHVTLGL